MGRLVINGQNKLRAFRQARSKNGVLPIGHRLVSELNAKVLGDCASAQGLVLRKDEPNPVAGLVASSELFQDRGIDAVLRFYKPLKALSC